MTVVNSHPLELPQTDLDALPYKPSCLDWSPRLLLEEGLHQVSAVPLLASEEDV